MIINVSEKPKWRECEYRKFRETVVHGLRSQGWSRIDAEDEADNRIERLRNRDSLER